MHIKYCVFHAEGAYLVFKWPSGSSYLASWHPSVPLSEWEGAVQIGRTGSSPSSLSWVELKKSCPLYQLSFFLRTLQILLSHDAFKTLQLLALLSTAASCNPVSYGFTSKAWLRPAYIKVECHMQMSLIDGHIWCVHIHLGLPGSTSTNKLPPTLQKRLKRMPCTNL